MRLIDALEILQRPGAGDGSRFAVSLACGCEPLHLRTFLAAELTQSLPHAEVDVTTGAFDDLVGNVRRAAGAAVDAIAVVVEWSDVDPRLGVRRLAGWRPADIADAAEQVELALDRLGRALIGASSSKPVVCCPPTLPLPPLFPQRPQESGAHELRIRGAMAVFLARLAQADGIRVCGGQSLDRMSPTPDRRDLRTELTAGFPYSLRHASAVAELLAGLMCSPAPKKGLITDLDDTLWAGIAGEVGTSTVSWSLEQGTHRHALYQQFLASLAGAGVLVGVASRNDPGVVAEVLARPDLALGREVLFPVQVTWGPKSQSIEKVLDVWNIAADAVVFVDDSPMEIDEARNRLPDLVGVRFPGGADADADLWPFLEQLRAWFGKSAVTAEDGLRRDSIRTASARRLPESDDEFLARAKGVLEFSRAGAHAARALELINKTNQFNLNGRRLTEAGFGRALRETTLVTASYEDGYGPLGIVAALLVAPGPEGLSIETWVMSCRAFSRRIEHHCLAYLFDAFGVDQITAVYESTDRNEPLRLFLASLLGASPTSSARLSRHDFDERAPALVHRVATARR